MTGDDHLTTDGAHPDDERLMRSLADLFDRVDPPPPWLMEAARLSFQMRTIDAELAELLSDSAATAVAAPVRGVAAPLRVLSFRGEDLAVEFELDVADGVRRVVGELDPPGPATVELRQPGHDPVVAEADDLGRFLLEGFQAGPLHLLVRAPGRRALACQWVVSD